MNPPWRTLAAVDCGTNSFHLVIARVLDDTRFEIIDREKAPVRLGSGSGDMKKLAPEAMDRAIEALTRFRRLADANGAPLRAVATSAVREADNREEFIERVRREAGVDLEVVAGIEEARLIHLGVLQAVNVYGRRALFVDIGGGSTELVLGEGSDQLAARSLKLGAIRLTDRFFTRTRVRAEDVEACRAFVRSAIAPFRREIAAHGFEVAVGSSGTVHAVAQIAQALRGGGEIRTLNNHRVPLADVHLVVDTLAAAPTVALRRRTPGLDPDRADIILAGAIILEQVLTGFGADGVVVSEYALREGVLLDTLQRASGGSLHHLRDVSRRSVQGLVELFDEEPEHSAHVAQLALRLFGETVELHKLPAEASEYLEAAALLANVGMFISHSKHHLHSYYVIRNSERLLGFTDREIEIIAQVARYHRKSAPKATHPEFARLWPEDQHLVRALAGMVRIAIGLDRSHRALVRDVRCVDDGRTLVIEAVPSEEAESDPEELSLELYAADQRKALLEDVLDRSVEIRLAR